MTNIVKGAKVIVFQDPIACTKLEGVGTVIKVIRAESWNDSSGNQIIRCNVRFPRTAYNDGAVYERDVSRLAS